MATPKKKSAVNAFVSTARKNRERRLRERMKHTRKMHDLKADYQKSSSSLLWVWEFSKKAVLICFMFYIITQLYAMVVMVRYLDFTYLGSLIDGAKEITRDCVFAYLIKAGLENIGKIWFSNKYKDTPADDGGDEPPVG